MVINRVTRRHAARHRLTDLSLLVSLACTPGLLQAQEAEAAASTTEPEPETVVSHRNPRQGARRIHSSPVQVLKAGEIGSAGRPDLMNALANVVPSFTAQAFGGDMANQTLQASCAACRPTTRWCWSTASAVTAPPTSPFSAAPTRAARASDLNFMPVDAIDHVEVLTEGAAAQYGTDAIAGVINIILKKDSQGGSVERHAGGTLRRRRRTPASAGNIGLEAMSGSYFNLAAEYREHEHTARGDVDPRVRQPGRASIRRRGPFPNGNMPFAAGYPYLNQICGDAAYEMKLVSLNGGIPIGDAAEIYAAVTWGDKHAASFENYRLPSRVSFTDPDTGEVTYFRPFGFGPREETEETDTTARLEGEVGGWNWDLSSTFGKDEIDMFTRDSANASLYRRHRRRRRCNFYDGTYTPTQWTTNLDVTKEIEVGMAGPLNFAFGAEYREETWEAAPGDEASRYLEGGQSFPGISLSTPANMTATSWRAYVDVILEPTEKLRLDIAGRYEDYSDFGDTTVGKSTRRYELTDRWRCAAPPAPASARRHWPRLTTRPPTWARPPPSCRCHRMHPPRRSSAWAPGCNPRRPPTSPWAWCSVPRGRCR